MLVMVLGSSSGGRQQDCCPGTFVISSPASPARSDVERGTTCWYLDLSTCIFGLSQDAVPHLIHTCMSIVTGRVPELTRRRTRHQPTSSCLQDNDPDGT
jgi:hypothetical protein